MSEIVTVLVWLAKATALLVIALGITIGLRRAPAGARYVVWLATLVALLLVPAVSSWSPLPLPILPSVAILPDGPSPQLATTQGATSPVIRSAHVSTPAADVPTAARTELAVASKFLLAWGVVAALLGGWLLLGAFAVRRIVSRALTLGDQTWLGPMYDVADRLDLDHAPRLVMSSAIEMPFACGILRPTIVLPTSAEQWSDERRRVVLFHELAHVRRRDLLGHTLGRIVCAFYWFHPLVWSAAKHLRAESERACDDLVLACGGARASAYANHLLEIVTAVRVQGAPATALPMANKREFEGRMLAILDPAVKRATPSRAQTAALTVGLGVLSLTIAAAAPARRPVPVSHVPSVAAAPQTLAVQSDTMSLRSASKVLRRVDAPMRDTSRSVPMTSVPSISAAMSAAVTSAVTSAFRSPGSRASLRDSAPDTALLARILRNDKDADVRKAAAWALQGRRDGVPLLLERLRVDEDGSVREMSAWALAGMPSTEAAVALADALKRDKSDEVRATSAWGLGHMGGMTDIAVLVAALDDTDADVRQRALWALGQHQLSSAPPRVVARLKDDNNEVRLMAAWVLGEILDKATIPALHEAFLAERNTKAMEAEFRALALMGDRTIIEPALKSEKPELRVRAVQMLGGHGPGVWPWPWPWPEPRPEP